MSAFLDMVTAGPKGLRGDGWRPQTGTKCLISGPNMDDEKGYVYGEYEVLWQDETFVVYRTPGCWPVIYKWEHCLAKPLPALNPTALAAARAFGAGLDDRSLEQPSEVL